ncbi:hypothetical protein [Sulfurimonas sp. HSL3-7]|uniref:hypothetical protein n=1 Tax=Sulfonitrofixus jiaomeiensis TaxID=3131938 RepID=UPI0031F7C40F
MVRVDAAGCDQRSVMGIFSGLFRSKRSIPVENSFEKMPIFHQLLQFPFPLDWPLEPLYRELEEGRFVIEFSAAGQSRENWQDKLIIQGFNNANDDVDMNARMLLKMMKEEMRALNEESFYYEELYSDTVLTREKMAVLMGLKELPDDKSRGQFGLYMVLEGEHDIYIVQRSWKGRTDEKEGYVMTRAELDAWLADFKKIELLDKSALPEGM